MHCPDSNDEQHRRTKTNTKSRHPSPVGTRRASCILPRSYGALLDLCTTDGAPGLTIPYTQIGLVGVFPYVFFHRLLHTTRPTHLLPVQILRHRHEHVRSPQNRLPTLNRQTRAWRVGASCVRFDFRFGRRNIGVSTQSRPHAAAGVWVVWSPAGVYGRVGCGGQDDGERRLERVLSRLVSHTGKGRW